MTCLLRGEAGKRVGAEVRVAQRLWGEDYPVWCDTEGKIADEVEPENLVLERCQGFSEMDEAFRTHVGELGFEPVLVFPMVAPEGLPCLDECRHGGVRGNGLSGWGGDGKSGERRADF